MAAALAGPQAAIRQETARPDDLRAVAAVLAARERPGDAIIYLPWGTAMVGMAYPAPFEALNDIELARSPVASASLRGNQVGPGTLSARLSGVHRVWVIRWAQPPSGSGYDRTDRAAAAAVSGMRRIGSWTVGSVVLSLYQVR
jgi:mannosyltransferase